MSVAVIPKKSPKSWHWKLCIVVLAGVTVNLLDTNGHLNLSFSSTLFIVSYYRKQIGEILAKLHVVVKESDHLIVVARNFYQCLV